VSSLATAAKWRSGGFGADDALAPGTLRFTVGGKVYPPADTPAPDGTPPITIDGATTLDSLAAAIRATGAPVAVNVLDDGTKRYLSITNLQTGWTGQQDDALKVAFQPADAGAPESFFSAPTLDLRATNASFSVDGLSFTRPTNAVSDVTPGTTLTLQSGGGPAETLSIGYDLSGTQTNLQKFVDSYNGLMAAIQAQMGVSKDTDRASTLAGDGTVRALQQALQSITSSVMTGQGTVHSLADLGVKTNRDGTLSIDSSLLSRAVARDPAAMNAVFSDATSGVAQRLSILAINYSSVGGLLSLRKASLTRQVGSMDGQAAQLQARIDAYRQHLVAQYTAMENLVSSFKSIGDFLTQQDNANKK
jgi:flagellar hook-associated protein 2